VPRGLARTRNALYAAWAIGIAATLLAFVRSAPLFVNLGAGDQPFASGFRTTWERDGVTGAGETMFHWTEDGSRLELPMAAASGRLQARLRLARFAPAPADIVVEAGGREVDRWTQPPLGWRVRTLDLGELRGPVVMTFRSRAADGSPLGVALDWAEITGAGALRPSAGLAVRIALALLAPPLVVLLLLRDGDAACATGALVGAAAGTAATVDRLGGLVAVAALAGPAVVALAVVAGAARILQKTWPEIVDHRAALVPLAGVVLALLLVSHPFYFYPDVDTHLRLLRALEANPLLLVDPTQPWARRGDLTREIGGQAVAIPYSMVFHGVAWLLSPLLGDVPAMKTVAAAAVGATLLLTHPLARSAGLGPAEAVVAQVLAVSMPVLTSRLVLALYPTLFGLAFVVLLLAHLARRFGHLDGARDAAAATAFLWCAQAAYTGSLVMVGLFVVTLGLLQWARGEPRRAWRLLGSYGVATGLVLIFYLGFLPVLVRDVLPHLGTSAPAPDAGSPLALGLTRLNVFYDVVFPLLIAGGFAVLWGGPPHPRRVLAAAVAAGGAVLVLRYVWPTLLRDAKEVELLAAPVAVLAAAALGALWRRRAWGPPVAVAAGAWAFVWGVHRSALWYAERFLSVGR
jgi:hypothetical protein